MAHAALIILLLKAGLVSGFAWIVTWAAVYTALTKGRNLRDPIGASLMLFALLIAGLFVPFTLSLFNLTRGDSQFVAWYDVTLIGAVTPAMAWQTLVWVRVHRKGRRKAGNGGDGAKPAAAGQGETA